MRQSIRKQEADQESMEKQRKKVCVMTCIEPLASIVAQVYNVCKEIGWIGGALMSGRVY